MMPDAAPPPSVASRPDLRLVLSFVAVTLIWGSTWLVIKGQLGVVPPSWSVAYRFLLGGGVVLALCQATGRRPPLGPDGHRFALLVGLLQFVMNFNFVYRAELYLTSGLVALVFTMLVVTNALLGWVFLRQRVGAGFIIGSLIGIAGVVLLVGRDLGGSPDLVLGLILAVAGVLSASSANILQATRRGRSLPLEPTLAASMLYGGAMNAGFALATVGAPVFDPRPEYWAGLLYLGVIASAAAFLIYYAMIRRIGAARAGYANVMVPVVAMSLSTLFEGYRWTAVAACGALLALCGLVVALRSRR